MDDVDDVAAVLVARMLVSDPQRVAAIVHNLDRIFFEAGLYEELVFDTPGDDVLPDGIDLDAGALEGGPAPGAVDETDPEF
jgi:hypothetical protein